MIDVRQSCARDEHPRRAGRVAAEGPRLHDAGHAGAGANNESKLGGLSIDGASAGENRYIIDGIETTNLQNGTSGKNLIVDFVEEVQVKSSGYTAEFGGATGGVINAVTKSGTNDIHGTALQLRRQLDLEARDAGRRCARTCPIRTPPNTSPIRRTTRPAEPGFALGGPIVANRLWFFGAYQPALTTIDRAVTPRPRQSDGRGTAEQKQQVHYLTATSPRS